MFLNLHGKVLMGTSEKHLQRVLIVDDDQNMRLALRRLFVLAGYGVELYESGTAFLEQADLVAPGCILLDLQMPGVDGLAVQATLNQRQCHLPLIFLTGSAAVRNAVDAMRSGATDFLEKPFDNEDLLRRVAAAIAGQALLRQARDAHAEVQQRLAKLTPREREVLSHIAKGLTNKEAARALGTSHRTVEIQRTRIMEKTQASSLADLVRMSLQDTA